MFTNYILAFIVIAIALTSHTKSSYLALGDSLAVGIAATYKKGYTCLYYKWLLACTHLKNIAYCNLGVIGWTSYDLLNAVLYKNNFRKSICNACIITLDIGGNDILKNKNCLDNYHKMLCDYKNNLYRILKEIQCLNTKAPIYLINIYNPYPYHHELYDLAEKWICSMNSIIWDIYNVRDFNVIGVADIYSAFKGNEEKYTLIKYDNVHPNTLGHGVIFNCLKCLNK